MPGCRLATLAPVGAAAEQSDRRVDMVATGMDNVSRVGWCETCGALYTTSRSLYTVNRRMMVVEVGNVLQHVKGGGLSSSRGTVCGGMFREEYVTAENVRNP